MDNKKEIKQFNKKLLVVFLMMLAIFTALLAVKTNAESQIQSTMQRERPNPTNLTYNDLMDYYDILCCQHGTALPSGNQVVLSGSFAGGSFNYDMGSWTGSKGEKRLEKTLNGQYYGGQTFKHKTYGLYSIIERHIATPKEAYIIAEMKRELTGGPLAGDETNLVYDQNGNPQTYDGNIVNAISYQLPTGETCYTVNQKYVLKVGDKYYYVTNAKDSDGNLYYVYETDSDGNLVEYTGELTQEGMPTYEDGKTGQKLPCLGINTSDVWYYDGEFSKGTKYPSNGTLYLVEFDVVKQSTTTDSNGSGSTSYTYVTGDKNYIQKAWWTTDAGSTGSGVVPNALSKEAEAFEAYILKITGAGSVENLTYAEHSYDFIEVDGTHSTGSVQAPVINYEAGFNEDADQNGVINEADEITPAFDSEKQIYYAGPFSLNYIKESAHIDGRPAVDFAGITGVELESNLGKLELGKDWTFKYLADQARDDNYLYPNPNEVFYIEINYVEGLTEINKFKFNFKYMNAGAELDIYDGNYRDVTWTAKTQKINETVTNQDGSQQQKWTKTKVWLECTSVVPHDSQTLAHALIGARWYEYLSCEKKFGFDKEATITIEKKTVRDDGTDEIVPIDKTYHFRIFINNKAFQDLTVTTENGYGKATSNKIVWKDGEANPSYKVIEIGEDANNGPWEGILPENDNLVVQAENYIAPHTGTLELDKKLLNPTTALESEVFSFTVLVSGEFACGNGPIMTHSAANPLVIDVTIQGAGEWHSEDDVGVFKWYGSAPHYRILENIDENATYELVNGSITNGIGELKTDGSVIATATNAPTTDWTIIEVDKKLISETAPQPGEVFTASLDITGKFWYEDDWIDGTLHRDIVLSQDNGWHWISGMIVWKNDEVPTYTLSEVSMAEGTKFVSISDEVQTGLINNFTGKLNSEKTLVVITNDRKDDQIGKLQISKLVETSLAEAKTFTFDVEVSGKFKYLAKQNEDGTAEWITVDKDNVVSDGNYTVVNEDGTTNDVRVENGTLYMTVSVTVQASDRYYRIPPTVTWLSSVFAWDEDGEAPKYKVTEVNLPEDTEFVSISNGEKTVTSSQTVEGTLKGISSKIATLDVESAKTVITCINRGTSKPEPTSGHIVIIKESENESLDDYVFFFKVKITGTFKYYNIVNEDGSLGYTQYTDETLVLDGKIDDVEAVCGGEDWISELIVWEKGQNPTYTVEEISIPEWCEFVSISNRNKTEKTPRIDGTLEEGTENNYITAINKDGGPIDESGKIRIVKKANEYLKGKIFNFDLKVTGDFYYAEKHYDAEHPFILKGIQVEANGNPWVSGQFTWKEGVDAPKYEVKEVDLPEDIKFVSISNETEMCTDSSMTITGTLREDKPVKLVAINYGGGPEPVGSHIEITKEVLNEALKGTDFYFNVKVTSNSPFKYHDLEDVTKVTEYAAGEVAEFNHVTVVADERDWVSGYFEWEEGADVPTYTISEITGEFPNGVHSVLIQNDTEKVVKELDNTSLEDLTIQGSLTGDVTHIIAVNDSDTQPDKFIGKLELNKLIETSQSQARTYTFEVEVNGNFKYYEPGVEVGSNIYKEFNDANPFKTTVTLDVQASDRYYRIPPAATWVSGYFEWDEGVDAPKYKVTEVDLPEGVEFVSISNEDKTVTDSQTIDGTLNGFNIVKVSGFDVNSAKTVLTCINREEITPEPTSGHIVIVKESLNESLDDYVFYFKVTISGTFKYYNIVNEDGSLGYTQYTNETLVLDGSVEDVNAVCGGEDWISELIEWEKGQNPTYTVEEINIPENSEFVSISNRDKTVKTPKIEGVVEEGTEYNYITAINNSDIDDSGRIRIVKKTNRALKGQIFKFDLKVTGEFDYQGVHYTNDNPYVLKGIEVKANSDPWKSEQFTWKDGASAPKYEVKEVELPEDVIFVSISNETEICTDPTVRTITGELKSTEAVKLVAINYGGGPEPTGSHIEITKEVLDESLKGVDFYFNVEVTSNSPFKYHDLEDVTKVTEYAAGDIVKFERVVAVADERDWVSGYFEWEEGADIPTYKISEITGAFPNGVHSISIRNDKDIIVKELDNTSIEDLVIEGTMTGDVTHIIAVNDSDTQPDKFAGKVSIEKKAVSPLIAGEQFIFTLELKGNFTYYETYEDFNNGVNGKDYKKLEIKDISITADGPKWESGIIVWDEKVQAPTYTVTEELAEYYDGVKFVSIRNGHQTNTQPAITGTVEGKKFGPNVPITAQDLIPDNWIIAENDIDNTPLKGRLQLHKVLLDENGNEIKDENIKFNFKLTLTFADESTQTEDIEICAGGYWRSDWYYWNKGENAPKYHLEEVNNKGYKVTIDKPDGELIAQDSEEGINGIITVEAQNTPVNPHKAWIRVNKIIKVDDKLSKDDVTVSFNVLVKVTGTFTYKGKAYTDDTMTLKVTLSKDNNWTWLSDEVKWVDGVEAPIFSVEEPEKDIPVGWHLEGIDITPEDGKLKDGETAVADVTNKWEPEEELVLYMKIGGKVWDDTNRKVDKHVDSKENGIIDEGEPGINNVKVKVYRALTDKNNGNIIKRLDGVYTFNPTNPSVVDKDPNTGIITLASLMDNSTYTDENGNWSFEAISVPAFTVAERESGQYGHYDNEGKFVADYVVTYDVEFEYDGQTYEPTEFLATANGDEKTYVGADSSNNMYSDVANRWTTVINSTTSERDKYLNDSMAIDELKTRTEFNNSFADIQGKEVMDDEGNTLGQTGSDKELHYTSVDSVSFFNSDNSRKVSTLRTKDDKGYIYNDLTISAATSNANLSFPFYTDNAFTDRTVWHLRSWDKIITDRTKIRYTFEAVYNYCLSINLGLVEREAADIATEKDLSEALVVVNGKALKYKFNEAIDFEDPDYTELLYKQLAVADSNIEYKLGLYKGDYYYRAEVYDGTDAGNALQGFYNKKFSVPNYNLDETELEVYLKYKINVYNQSETYDVTIGEVADYYDSTFKLIEETESKYIQTINGKEVDNVMDVATPSTVSYLAGTEEKANGNVAWVKVSDVDGSDGIKYNKITTSSLAGTKLATGEKAEITVTFKVEKDAVGESGVLDTIKLGQKHNVAELTKFTSYYSEKSENRWSTPGQISGRVDEDSAPDNVNVRYYNEKTYYEDDTDSAPIITIGLTDETRAISGIVWDDAQTASVGYGQVVGDGLYNPEQGDKLINGLTTEIYESITVPEETDNGEKVYREYQFAWPTGEKMSVLGGHSLEELTGFKQAVVTENGEYSFINVPAGNYKVRYVYGDKKIETGKKGSEEVYSGQDYKTTAYQIGFNNDRDNDGYVDNEWHDITNTKLNDLRVNDARDDEARRLYISAKSEMLTYDNSSLLAKADNKNADHTQLFGDYQGSRNNPVTGDGYYMYAETAKINLGVENIYKIGYTTETINGVEVAAIDGKATENGRDVGTSDFTYNIKNVDCGIEERSQTKLTLDKQIKQITLMTSDNKVILDAVYDINYTLKPDGSIASTVTLNEQASTGIDHIASLNRNGNNQGYRYVIAEGTILQGTQIQVKYQLTVFNMSETDRISKDLDTLWSVLNKAETEELKNNTFDAVLKAMTTPLYTESKGRVYEDTIDGNKTFVGLGFGRLFGSVYYLGSQGVGVRPDETIVKTKVHQMIDYIDPDVEFTDMNNISRDQSWSNTDIEYLIDNHLIAPSTVQVLDSEGRVIGNYENHPTLGTGERYSIISDKLQEYKTDAKNNLVLTVDNDASGDTGTNPGFIKFLEPYMADNNVDRSTGAIALTVTRFYSSETDASDIDNLAEIIKVENTAGRRDSRNISGNANPYQLDESNNPIGIYAVAQGKEKDASATEVITLSPPTGLDANESRTMQLVLVVLISVTLVAVAIVIIKKKVLIKN